jgi:CheY-like chemotaxis protein
MAANVLVVEDDRLNRNLICKVLRNEGHQVVEASDGAEGLELLYAQHFDLVITDFVMPRLNGLKFVEQLHPLQPRLPIIFITGYLSAISGKCVFRTKAATESGAKKPPNPAQSGQRSGAKQPPSFCGVRLS